MIVVVVLGTFLFQQINRSVVESSQRSATSDAFADRLQIADALTPETDDPTKPVSDAEQGAGNLLDDVMNTVTGSGENGSEKRYEVLVLNLSTPGQSRASGSVVPADVPLKLRLALQRNVRAYKWEEATGSIQTIRFRGESQPRLTFVVGGIVHLTTNGRTYEVYHFFPFDEEEELLSNVRLAIVVVGLGLVLLLAAIAYLVARQVVTPVRLARQAAERLASGRLDERLKVRGEDDLARLANSFNEMAANLALKIHQLEELSQVQRQFVSDVSHELRTPLTTVRMAADLLYDAPRGLRADGRPLGRAHAGPARTVSSRCWPTCWRSAATTPAPPRSTWSPWTSATWCCARSATPRRWPSGTAPASSSGCPTSPAWPRSTTGASSGSCATCCSTPSSTARAGTSSSPWAPTATPWPSPYATTGSGSSPARTPWSSTASGGPTRRGARTIGGTGLGLAISREDAGLHGGWLQAWGQPGEGSQFRLTLPRNAGVDLKGSPLSLVPPEIEMRRTWRTAMTPVLLPASGDGAEHDED
ncbi:hypothetical protein GCM10020220_032580 [Nonomuraea rubra]